MNNLTRLYKDSGLLCAMVDTLAIYADMLPEGLNGAEIYEWMLSDSEPAETYTLVDSRGEVVGTVVGRI